MNAKIYIKEVEFDVFFDYEPEEKQVRYYPDGSGYPGCPASIYINGIEHKGTDFTEFFCDNMKTVEEKVWECLDKEETSGGEFYYDHTYNDFWGGFKHRSLREIFEDLEQSRQSVKENTPKVRNASDYDYFDQ